MSELVWMTAVELADQMRRGEVSAVEVLTAHLEQIEAVNPALNAIVTYLPEMALDLARKPMSAKPAVKNWDSCMAFRLRTKTSSRPRASARLPDRRCLRTMCRKSMT